MSYLNYTTGRENFENSQGKQLKIAQKRVAQWEAAVKVAEKAKPMNRHERQLCYTFKYYDKNEAKRTEPLKLKKLNGLSVMSVAQQMNGVAENHENKTSGVCNVESVVSEVKAVNGVGVAKSSVKTDQRKTTNEKTQRKRKLSSIAGTSKLFPNHVEASKASEPPKKRKKQTAKKQSSEVDPVESTLEVTSDRFDIPINLNMEDKMDFNSDLHGKCNGVCSKASSTPPRLNGDISAYGANMEVSPNTALKLKIRKITPEQTQKEGKRKRGRPRKPHFVIVSESESSMEVESLSESPDKVKSTGKQSSSSGKDSMLDSDELRNGESILTKKRIRKPSSKVLSAQEVAILMKKDSTAVKEKKKASRNSKKVKDEDDVDAKTKKVKKAESAEVKSKKEAQMEVVDPKNNKLEKIENVEPKCKKIKVEERNSEPSELSSTVEIEGSVTSSSDDTGSIKNGTVAKKEKDAVCVVCEQQDNLTHCEGICGNAFHLDCIGLSVVPKGKFICDECVTGNHCCFVCRQTGNVKQCCQPLCTKFYHDECLRIFKTAKFDGDRFFCPLHFCGTCVSNKSAVTRKRMIRCVRCPTAYHVSGCLVAGCIPVSSQLMVCAKHFLREKNKAHHTHVNVNWCFVCSIGGTLICCESCPAAFHPECISYEGIPEGHFFCKDCTEGKQLLYGDIVWVKLGMYR